MRLALVLALTLCGASARADLWQRHDDHPPVDVARDRFIQQGNAEIALIRRSLRLNQLTSASAQIFRLERARAALADYEHALAIAEDVDTHYLALLAAEEIDEPGGTGGICTSCADGFAAVVRHADAIRRLDPMTTRELELTDLLAWALSKLGGLGGPDADADFARAIAEYDHWHHLVDEANQDLAKDVANVHTNQAEIEMAAGRLDDAIAEYRVAVELYPLEALGYYGLAVAYDRDGQWAKAVDAMQTAFQKDPDVSRLHDEHVFFVPDGDAYYYYGLIQQIRGDAALAITQYTAFLAHVKNSRYAARAREHLDELQHRTK